MNTLIWIKETLRMLSTLVGNIVAFATGSNWISKIVAIVILWLSPALELFLLLMAIVALDYLLDIWEIYRKSDPNKNCKEDIWKQTKMFFTKVMFYSIMVILINALQVHLIKETFDLFRWVIALPIIGESITILTTIEKYTGIKIVDSFIGIIKKASKKGADTVPDEVFDNLKPKDDTTKAIETHKD